ncbi:MAG: hypothetical protein Kow00121_49970 [Elainellaceae cyanobacterium]
MNRIILRLRSIQLRQVLATVMLSLVLLVSSAFGHALQAQAAPLTPEAREYDVDSLDQHQLHPEQATENAGEAVSGFGKTLENAADTVREKLNLDEPLPESTRDFIKQVKGEDVDIEEPRPFGK